MEIMRRLFKEEEGQGLVEYALIIGLISLVVIVAGPAIYTALATTFNEIITGLKGSTIATSKS
jgi:pilus assembly protein Flp/PilA